MPTVTRPSGTGQDCLHSREPFDTLFRCVAERRDISPAAKLVHGRLVSQHRLGAAWTQAEIGTALGLSRHQVWAAIQELIAAGLVVTIRYGLGRPNGYVLLGIDTASLEGRSSRQQEAGQGSGSRARTSVRKEQRKNEVFRTPVDYTVTRLGHVPPR
jgi:biotin operon repressor